MKTRTRTTPMLKLLLETMMMMQWWWYFCQPPITVPHILRRWNVRISAAPDDDCSQHSIDTSTTPALLQVPSSLMAP